MEAHYVIKKPVLTEKATHDSNEENRYHFEVDRRATKDDIREAIEKLYRVTVTKVATKTCRDRDRRTRFGWVRGKITKKAIVRLKDGDTIELI
ncbi:MAG: 50S ribosomal protein L23 [Planctomycetota bacterium]